MPTPVYDQQLVLHQQAVSNDSLGPAWSKKPRNSAQQMSDEDENVSHDRVGSVIPRCKTVQATVLGAEVEFATDTALKQKLERDLSFAQQIQKDYLPQTTPKLAGYNIAGWNLPAEQTGGDAYDFFAISPQRIGLFIADASGHGIGPALVVAECRALVRALASTTTDLRQVILGTNSVLCEDLGNGRFVTACLAVLDNEAGTIECMSAGQAPSFHYISVEDRFVNIFANTLPMGIVADPPMEASKPIPFAAGDLLILITDGCYEWRRPDSEQFGVDRLLDVIRRYRERSCDEIIRRLQAAVLDFSEGSEQSDDLTVIILKRENART
jgi:serine phosphatase RsbU (regulator of sigma subunit)